MATYISPSASQSQFVSGVPLDLVMQVGSMKQQQYNQNLASIQSPIDLIGSENIVREADKEIINRKLNDVVTEVNKFADADLIDPRVHGELMGVVNQLYTDRDITSRISANRERNSQMASLQEIKEKNPGLYNPLNESVFLKNDQD